MNRDNKASKYIPVKSMFISGSVSKMRDLEKLFPSAIAKDLKMNHSRYVNKLYKPETFSAKQILAFSKLIEVDSRIVWDVIAKQSETSKLPKTTKRVAKKKGL